MPAGRVQPALGQGDRQLGLIVFACGIALWSVLSAFSIHIALDPGEFLPNRMLLSWMRDAPERVADIAQSEFSRRLSLLARLLLVAFITAPFWLFGAVVWIAANKVNGISTPRAMLRKIVWTIGGSGLLLAVGGGMRELWLRLAGDNVQTEMRLLERSLAEARLAAGSGAAQTAFVILAPFALTAALIALGALFFDRWRRWQRRQRSPRIET